MFLEVLKTDRAVIISTIKIVLEMTSILKKPGFARILYICLNGDKDNNGAILFKMHILLFGLCFWRLAVLA